VRTASPSQTLPRPLDHQQQQNSVSREAAAAAEPVPADERTAQEPSTQQPAAQPFARQQQQAIRNVCTHHRLSPPQQKIFFFNRLPKGSRINEKGAQSASSPAKIVPLKPPKEIQSKTCPRCAMQQILNDRLKA
jgi:hypothetical protein